MNEQETVEIEGIQYFVVGGATVAGKEAARHPYTAAMMRDAHLRRELYLRRPRGQTIYFAYERESGSYTSPKFIVSTLDRQNEEGA